MRLVPTADKIDVEFIFEDITDLKLDGEDVNRQNAINSLAVELVAEGIRVAFWPCYGLTRYITARDVRVQMATTSESEMS